MKGVTERAGRGVMGSYAAIGGGLVAYAAVFAHALIRDVGLTGAVTRAVGVQPGWIAAAVVAASLAAVLPPLIALRRALSAKTARGTYQRVRSIVLTLTSGVALSWAVVGLDSVNLAALAGFARLVGAVALVGVASVVGGGLYLIAVLHQRVVLEEGARQGDSALSADHDCLSPRVPRPVAGVIVALLALAVALPADLFSFRPGDFGAWMRALTDWIGPLFVPRSAPARQLGEVVATSVTGLTHLLTVGLLALLVVGVLALRRRGPRSRGRPLERAPWGLRWFWEEIVERVVAWFRRLFGSPPMLAPADRSVRARERRATARSRAPQSVAELYAMVVARLARRGLVRRPAETPFELLARWQALGGRGDDFPRLTREYVATRYAGRAETADGLASARRAAASFLKRFRLSLRRPRPK